MIKVLGLGDNVCDVYLHTEMMYPGGQALNFSVYAKELGVDSDFMGVFGDDAVADYNKFILCNKEIGFSHCRSYKGENGFAKVTLVDGDRVFMGSNKGGVIQQNPIYFDEDDLIYLKQFDLIHTTNNGFTENLLPVLSKMKALISYDFSSRWNEEERIKAVCPYIDFGFLSCSNLNDDETESLCKKMVSEGCRIVIATRGEKGATVYDGAKFYRQAPQLVTAIDTMGAGDSFATAMLTTILLNTSDTERFWKDVLYRSGIIEESLKKAAEFSAKTCLVSGAFGEGITVPEEIKSRIYKTKDIVVDKR